MYSRVTGASPDKRRRHFVFIGKTRKKLTPALLTLLRSSTKLLRMSKVRDIKLVKNDLSLHKKGKLFVKLSPGQFRFLAALVRNSPGYVTEKEMFALIFPKAVPPVMHDALSMLAYRLRKKLGPQLAKRLRKKKRLGWKYVQPRAR